MRLNDMTKKLTQTNAPEAKHDKLSQLKMLVALDALLRHGSVSLAAEELGMQVSSLSRLLQTMRDHFKDPLFTRTGRGLSATAFAETLRLRLRSLAAEADCLSRLDPSSKTPVQQTLPDQSNWEQPSLLQAPPLAARPSLMLDGQPSPQEIANQLATIGHNDEPQRRLAKYIAISSMSSRQSRPLAKAEASDALGIILSGESDPVQIGALLATMQYRGPTAAEIAGFLEALWAHIGRWPQASGNVDLDWPAYLSPRYRSPPWFLQSAMLVRDAGYRVALHGHYGQGSNSGKLELAASDCGIAVCRSILQASKAVSDDGIAYLPIGAICPQFQKLLNLYPLLEMRLPLGTVMHLANPLSARHMLMGVANPSYRELHRDVVRILDLPNIAILGNIRDIAQVNPTKSTPIFGRCNGADIDLKIPAIRSCAGKHALPFTSREYWSAIWSGAARDEQVENTIISTAAAALMTIKNMELGFSEALDDARSLWAKRDKRLMMG
jgi:anthranilate phosphoribosyltransferase/molybdenum-dependent DNA-binding transcriptional regulator ModE